jgi:hypothetical protein
MSYEADPAPEDVELFDSPEAAALSGWRSTPAAHARVIAVEAADSFDGVYVTVQTDVDNGHRGFYDIDTSNCVRAPQGKWWENGSSG